MLGKENSFGIHIEIVAFLFSNFTLNLFYYGLNMHKCVSYEILSYCLKIHYQQKTIKIMENLAVCVFINSIRIPKLFCFFPSRKIHYEDCYENFPKYLEIFSLFSQKLLCKLKKFLKQNVFY